MERITLYLWLSEPGYAEALARSLQETELCYSIHILDEEPAQLNLPDGSLLVTDLPGIDRPGLVRMEAAAFPEVSSGQPQGTGMYQSVRRISEALKSVYCGLTGRRLIQQCAAGMKIISFHGAEGGAGCSSLAQAFCQELRRFRGRRVLLLSLEEFPSTDRFYPMGGPPGGLARMTETGIPGSGHGPRLSDPYETADENGVLSFQPPPGRNPLREWTPDELVVFVEWLGASGRYDVLVADCGTGLDPLQQRMAVLADNTVLVAGPEGHGQGRVKRFCETLERRMTPSQAVLWHRVQNRMGDEYWQLDVPEEAREILRIPEEKESFQYWGGLSHISLDKELGRGVRTLADRMPGL